MKQIKVRGGNTLSGTINIGGAKNSAVALIPAAILSDGIVEIDNIPNISDIEALKDIMNYLGASVTHDKSLLSLDLSSIENKEIPYDLSSRLRASYYFMAALLGRYKKVSMWFPGGCKIGNRPIDQTLKSFKKLGAEVKEEDNKFTITAKELKGSHIYLDMPSVGATINTMLVACKAKGETIIDNAAKEPEIVNVATFLNNMGARIIGAGTSEIKIIGVDYLKGAYVEVIPDRIEAGTYMIAGALLGENLKINNLIPDHVEALTSKLLEIGVDVSVGNDFVVINKKDKYKPVNVKTLGYPGFPTDLQQPFTTLLTQCTGKSKIEETIYENRFQNVQYLNKMGSNIEINDRKAIIYGPTNLTGCEVTATDLRAGACVVLAGLIAEGETVINDVEHILRGYENIIEKLLAVGADIELIEYN